ncbi:uncharacterized protein LOC123267777 [Cotesia glomerata]|uniref:Replication protein A OB domain-containing protein n=1 Tax=Cotesia glomerata TaxID=32391 RepID=A0AAV7HU03_COTGL|nr:uncharacterized protein LOC123267777 [Cotesia glomerata]KAH0535130.1 hypothetical protein KQX54_013929 [Cotesia glomerata]
MARQYVIDNFTCDEEISHWVVDDDCIELCGYVDEVVGMKKVVVGRAFNDRIINLLSVIVNNGGNSRICVLFWGDTATQLFGNLSERSIITIKRAKAQKRNSQFHDPEDGVGPIELSTTQVSTVVIENFLFHPLKVPIPPQHQGNSCLVQRRSEDLLQD